MRLGAGLTLAAFAATLGAAPLSADMKLNGPTEVPPPSYAGRQFVDSAGCVFVKAGFSGSTAWVPRVNRDKSQLCGYQPTKFAAGRALEIANHGAADTAPVAAAPAPAPAAAPTRTVAAPARPVSPFAPTPGVGRPMPTIALTTKPPRIGPAGPAAAVASAAPLAAPTVPAPAVSPAPRAVAVAAAAPPSPAQPATIVAIDRIPGAGTACPNAPAVAQRYRLSDGRSVLRCSADASDPVGFINRAAVPGVRVAGVDLPAAPVRPGVTSPAILSSQQAYASASPYQGYPSAGGAPVAAPALYAASRPAPEPAPYGGAGYGATPPQAATPASPLPRVAAEAPKPLRPQPVATVAPSLAGQSPQQLYAQSSPYQSVPHSVRLLTPTGEPALAPTVVSTDVGTGGYKAAYDDGRLNPYRGPRSVLGDAQQAQLWTNRVPARQVTTATAPASRVAMATPIAQARADAAAGRVSAKSVAPAAASARAPTPGIAPLAARPGAARYVQVGTFAVPANAAAARARLAGLGLPVATSALRRGGRPMTIVLAGPFAPDAARSALSTARSAGFGDAILR